MDKIEILKMKNKLTQVNRVGEERAESIVHALIDIEESLNTIYKITLPKILENSLTADEVQDLIWDIREDFRHIDYHIHDADLINL